MSLIKNCLSCCLVSSKVIKGGVLGLVLVRWRKHRSLPKAPSKIFRVRTPTPIDPEEAAFLQKYQKVYGTEERAVRSFLTAYEMSRKAKAQISEEDVTKAEEEDWKMMVQKNDAWNFEVGLLREADMAEVERKKALKRQKIQERDERERTEMLVAAEQRFLKEKANFESFITPDKLDSELDRVLNTRSDYDFALKPDGTIFSKDTEQVDEMDIEDKENKDSES